MSSHLPAQFNAPLSEVDPEIAEALANELARQRGTLEMIASENFVPRAVLEALPTYPRDDPSATLHALGQTLQRALGGTSGALYALFFLRASARLRGRQADDPRAWADAMQAACEAIGELGGARAGDRTMLDALLPASDVFRNSIYAGHTSTDALGRAADAAEAGAKATADLMPRRGRSSYLGARALGHPDPGAMAVAVWLEALAQSQFSS